MLSHIEDSPNPDYALICALLKVLMHVDDSTVNLTILSTVKKFIPMMQEKVDPFEFSNTIDSSLNSI